VKLYVIWPDTLEGRPEARLGGKRARCAAYSAACRSSGFTLLARADVTLPVSSAVTCKTTARCARAALGIAGHAVCGRLIALSLSEPPETGALHWYLSGGNS
jgi:hypothetical protein